MPSSTSSSEHPGITRVVPELPWSTLAVTVAIAAVLGVAGWEAHCRGLGYAPGLNDTTDLWCDARRSVRGDSTVIIGASRALFDLDLDELQHGLGTRPLQLALVGTCVYPELRELADDRSFHGTVICDVVPGLLTAPYMAPPYKNGEKAVKRLHTQTWSQRWGFQLSLPLERTFACLQQEDLTLSALLREIPIPNREHAQLDPPLPPHFSTIERDRRTRMLPRMLTDPVLCDRVKHGWPALFTPPPKPVWIPDQAFGVFMGKLFNDRFSDFASAVADLRARGARVVFVRLPSGGDLLQLEERMTPRAAVYDRLLRQSGAPGVYWSDHPELAGYRCPEWSHLSADDSVSFSRSLVPLIKAALEQPSAAPEPAAVPGPSAPPAVH
jgi:hypothetical protein